MAWDALECFFDEEIELSQSELERDIESGLIWRIEKSRVAIP